MRFLLAIFLLGSAEGIRMVQEECNAEKEEERIPDHLHFNYRFPLIESDDGSSASVVTTGLSLKEQLLVRNLKNTIAKYKERNPHTKVSFLDNQGCKSLIEEVHGKELARLFEEEKGGAYKSDICRLAQIYKYGGHYLDNDMEVVQAPQQFFPPCTSFSSVITKGSWAHQDEWFNSENWALPKADSLFQSYMAASKGHPLIWRAMDMMVEAYHGNKWLDGDKQKRGPVVLAKALQEHTWTDIMHANQAGKGVHVFHENTKDKDMYRPATGLCNSDVVDAETNQRVFWSRSMHKDGFITCAKLATLGYDDRQRIKKAKESDPEFQKWIKSLDPGLE